MEPLEPTAERNLDGYDNPPLAWARVRDRLTGEIPQAPGTGGPGRHTTWIATVNPDGRPHVVAVGGQWLDGRVYFTSGPGTRKSRNLILDPHCTVSVATDELDIVVEGVADRVTDDAELERIAGVYAAGGWPARAEGGALTADYSAPSAGPPPWYLYRVTPRTVYAVAAAEPWGATRWDFA